MKEKNVHIINSMAPREEPQQEITERKLGEKTLGQSEEKYRLLIDNIHDGVFIIQDAKMQFVNKAFAAMIGYSVEEIIGMDFRRLVAPEDLEMVADRYKRRQEGEDVPQEYEFSMLHKDGKTRVLVDMKASIINYRGRVASMGTVMDITGRKLAEDRLRQSEERYRNLVELTSDIIYISDREGNQVFMNNAGYRILEISPGEVLGRQWSMWIHPEDRERSYKKFMEMIEKGIDVFSFENRYVSKSGKVIKVLHNIRVLRNEKGEIEGTQGIARDITERTRMEDSLRLFSEAVEGAPDGVQIVDLDGYISYSNRAVEEIYGFSHRELRGKHVNELNVDPEFAGRIIIPSIIETGRWVGELMVKHKEGRNFPVWLTASMVKDRNGKQLAMVGIISDITERKRIEKALQESEARYRSLFENSPISIWEEDFSNVKNYIDSLKNHGVKDLKTYFETHPDEVLQCAALVKVLNVNRATVSLFKANDKEDFKIGLSQIFTSQSYDMFREELIAISEGKIMFEGEDIVKNFKGELIPVYFKWSVAPGHEVTYSKRLISILDITERKRAEEAIKRYAEQLEEANRMKELFTDIMHHDLINPLNTANGFIEILKENETDIKKKTYLETVERNLFKSMELIENATKLSKLESSKTIDYEDMDLKKVIDEVTANFSHLADRAGMDIENNIKQGMPVKANKIIEEVFSNFISNAVKYALSGKRIVVDGEDGGECWRVKVIDFGKCINDEDKKRIFERFRRMDTKGVKGSGLGLAIARKIVELHRGSIWVEDNPEGGAVFVVDIPKADKSFLSNDP